MKLGDLFYTRVKDGKVICYQLYRVSSYAVLKHVTSNPHEEINYSFRRINPISMKSIGNCIDGLSSKEALNKFKPLTEAIKILFTKEQV